jgi:glycosyltransferase involved in cell wall biosynthesis
MACGVPCIGKIPDMKPEWMTEDNGIWMTDITLFPDFVADFIQNWLEDNIVPEMFENMKKTVEKYKNKQEFDSKVISLFENYLKTRADSFESQLSKTEE